MTAPPSLHPDTRPPAPPPPARLQISMTQVLAAALAAISATVVASFFGVAGTVIGAAISSVFSVVGTAVYSHSLRRTRERMREVVPVTIRRVPRSSSFPPQPGIHPPAGSTPTYPQPHGSTALGYGPVRYSRPRSRSPWRARGTRLALGSAALFVAVLALVTGIEAVAQRPLSDLVRGNDAVSGTSLFGSHGASHHAHRSGTHRSAHPTVTQTVTRTSAPSTAAATHTPSPTHTTPPPSSTASTPPPSATSSGTASPPAADRTGGTAPIG
jgi:hypothetical protein